MCLAALLVYYTYRQGVFLFCLFLDHTGRCYVEAGCNRPNDVLSTRHSAGHELIGRQAARHPRDVQRLDPPSKSKREK